MHQEEEAELLNEHIELKVVGGPWKEAVKGECLCKKPNCASKDGQGLVLGPRNRTHANQQTKQKVWTKRSDGPSAMMIYCCEERKGTRETREAGPARRGTQP